MIFFCDAFDAHSTPMLCVYEISWWRICSHPNKKPTYLSYLWGWKTNSVFDFFIPPSSMMSTCLNLFRRLGLISISEGVVCFNFFLIQQRLHYPILTGQGISLLGCLSIKHNSSLNFVVYNCSYFCVCLCAEIRVIFVFMTEYMHHHHLLQHLFLSNYFAP